jgi:hypothetical protein
MKRKSVTLISDSSKSNKKARPTSVDKMLSSSSNENITNIDSSKKIDLFRLVEQIAPLSAGEYMFGKIKSTNTSTTLNTNSKNNQDSSEEEENDVSDLFLF